MNKRVNYFRYAYTLLMIVVVSFLTIIISAIFSYYASVAINDIANYKEKSYTLNNNTVYVEAPIFRTDYSKELIQTKGVDNSKYLFTQQQIKNVERIPNVSQVYYLTGESLMLGEVVLPEIDATISYKNKEIDSSVYLSTFSNTQVSNIRRLTKNNYEIKGNFPLDSSNRVLVSSAIDNVEIGQSIKVNGNTYIISGIIDSDKKQIVLPYEEYNYKDHGQEINMSYLENPSLIDEYYGNLLILFRQKPTSDDLSQIYSFLNNGAIYYRGFLGTDTDQFLSMFVRVINNYATLVISALIISIGLTFVYLMIKYRINHTETKMRDIILFDLSFIFGAELLLQIFITLALLVTKITNLYLLLFLILLNHLIILLVSAFLFSIYTRRSKS